MKTDIISFVKAAIEKEKYIFLLIDTYYNSNYSTSNDIHYLHENLLYGYDDAKEEIYFMDNYKYGAYVSGKISYLDFMKSYQSVSENKYTDWYNGIYILSYKKVYDYGMCIFKKTYKHKFDLHIVHKLICDFLDEEPTDEMWVLPASLCGEEKIEIPKKYGIGIYNYLLEYVDLLQKDVQLEFRAFYTLCEHKKIIDDLIRRIYSIIGETHLQQKINKLSKQCLDMSEIVNGLSIKYYVNPNKDILKKIKTLLYNLKRADYALFNDLKNEINNYFEMLG